MNARFEKVEKVPSNDEAQDNVLYLVMNAATGYYDIYAKVGEEVVRLDDTTVDLSNYATIEQLNAVSGGIGGTAYAGTKEDLSASDDSVIAAYFKAHTDVAVKKGDVFVVTTTVGNSTYEKSAYFYNGKAWVAMTGNVDADKVILRENITLAGGYTQVGNLTKSQNGTATFATKGKSVMDALTEIFSKRLQPSITAQPSIGTFTLTGAGAVEAGTKVAAAAYSGATLNAGSYQYGPATGVTATNWKVERITNAATTQVTTADAASLTAGSDNNGGAGFIIGDAFALDPTCVWPSLAEAQNYAKTNPTAYIGQVLSVVADGVATAYTIKNAAGDLAPLGAAAVDIATDSEVSEMLSEVFPTDNT